MEIFITESKMAKTLEGLLQILSKDIAFVNVSEGESLNYSENIYFEFTLKGRTAKLYYLDTEGLEKWPYILDCPDLETEYSEEIARKIAELGCECFIPEGNWCQKSWVVQGKCYKP